MTGYGVRPSGRSGTGTLGPASRTAEARHASGSAGARPVRAGCEDLLATTRVSDDPLGVANAWRDLGEILFQDGEMEQALAAFERAEGGFLRARAPSGVARAQVSRGRVLTRLGRMVPASLAFQAARRNYALARSAGGEIVAALFLGEACLALGAVARSREWLRFARQRAARAGWLAMALRATLALGRVAMARGRYRDALRLARRAQVGYRNIRDVEGEGWAWVQIASVRSRSGAWLGAWVAWRRSRRRFEQARCQAGLALAETFCRAWPLSRVLWRVVTARFSRRPRGLPPGTLE